MNTNRFSRFAKMLHKKWMLCLMLFCVPLLFGPVQTEAATITAVGGTLRYDFAFRILDLVNKERAKAGISPVKMDMQLTEAAMQRAAEVQVLFSHTRPDDTGYGSTDPYACGENIAMASTGSPETLMNMWMGSAGHRANILSSSWQTIGIGVYQNGYMLSASQLFGWDTARAAAVKKPNVKRNIRIPVIPENIWLSFGDIEKVELTEGKKTSHKLTVFSTDVDPADLKTMSAQEAWIARTTATYVQLAPTDFVWTSSNPRAATVGTDGTVRYAGVGTAVISATLSGTGLRTSVTVTCRKRPPFTVSVKTKTYTYNGKARKPAVTVKVNGKTVSKKYYTVKYSANKNVGTATVTVTGKGKYKDYSGTASFTIKMKKGALSSVKSRKKGQLEIKWKKDSQANYYQIQISTSKNFKSGVRTVEQVKGTACIQKDLASGKRYYVRVRPVRRVNGKLWQGAWSSAKKVKVK